MFTKTGAACFCAALLALTPTLTFAASTDAAPSSNAASKSALAPAGAAGVKKAEGMGDDTFLWVGGALIVAGGIALIASGGSGHHHATTTTSTP